MAKRKFNPHEFIAHFLFGALGGALLGYALWVRYDAYTWSKEAAIACTIAGGLMGGFYMALKSPL